MQQKQTKRGQHRQESIASRTQKLLVQFQPKEKEKEEKRKRLWLLFFSFRFFTFCFRSPILLLLLLEHLLSGRLSSMHSAVLLGTSASAAAAAAVLVDLVIRRAVIVSDLSPSVHCCFNNADCFLSPFLFYSFSRVCQKASSQLSSRRFLLSVLLSVSLFELN